MPSRKVEEIVLRMGVAIGGSLPALGGTLKFDFGEDGSVFIDGKSSPNRVCSGEGLSADCTIVVTLEDFDRMARGELDGTSAFMQGKLRVAGEMGLALKIGPLLKQAHD